MSTPNPVIQLVANPLLSPSGDLSEWSFQGFPQPHPLSTYWNSSTLLPANGSGGNIPFPTFNSYTPTAYTAPATNAPAGNAAFVGWLTSTVCGAVYTLPPLVAGTRYTVTFYYAGNPSATNLNWYFTAFVGMPDGALGLSPQQGTLVFGTFDPSAGWYKFSFSFIADQSTSSATVNIYGGGTDGTVTYGNGTSITSGTVMAPMLIADVSVTYPSAGSRANPPSALPVGQTIGTVMSGGDSRIPRLDSQYHLRAREERLVLAQIDGNISTGMVMPQRPILPSINGCYITSVTFSCESLASGTGVCTIDVLINMTSIFQVPSVTPLPTLTGTLTGPSSSFTQPGYRAVLNYFIGAGITPGLGAVMASVDVLAAVSAVGLLVEAWVYNP